MENRERGMESATVNGELAGESTMGLGVGSWGWARGWGSWGWARGWLGLGFEARLGGLGVQGRGLGRGEGVCARGCKVGSTIDGKWVHLKQRRLSIKKKLLLHLISLKNMAAHPYASGLKKANETNQVAKGITL
ncbi:Aminomethyltransferase [Bienertia sinuspersici]